MTPQSIFSITTLLVLVASLECSSFIMGGRGSSGIFSKNPHLCNETNFGGIRYYLVEKCCKGYVQNNNGICGPQCESGCENGYCSMPGQCACNAGYEETLLNTCLPICEDECVNGNCTGPNDCTCYEGYRMNVDGFTCELVCSSSCENGWCSKPNVCECHPGYKKTDDNKCEFGSNCTALCTTSSESSSISSGAVGSVIGIALLAIVAIVGIVIFMRIGPRRRKVLSGEYSYTQRLVNDVVDVNPIINS